MVRRFGRPVTLQYTDGTTESRIQAASRRATQDDLVGSAYQYNYLYTLPAQDIKDHTRVTRGVRIIEADGAIRTIEHVHRLYVGDVISTLRCAVSG